MSKINEMDKAQHKQDVGDRLRIVIEKTHGPERGAQAKWARDHKVKEQRLTNWLRGRSYPDVGLMIDLTELGFTLDWLYRGVKGGVSLQWEEFLREKLRASQEAFPAKVRQAHEKTSNP
jgi:S-formylglutathione hydrolase FrmB